MLNFNMYCGHCGYSGEQQLKFFNSRVNCPECTSPLEKGVSFPNISTTKTREKIMPRSSAPKIVDTPFGRYHRLAQIPIPENPLITDAHIYEKEPSPGDAELN